MLSENAISPRVSTCTHAKRLHLASSNSNVVRVSTLAAANLRLVSHNPALTRGSGSEKQPKRTGSDEQSRESRTSFIRMSIAAALAPGLWLLHTFAQQIQHAF